MSEPSPRVPLDPQRPRAWWAFAAVFAACLGISLARDPGALGLPALLFEDARVLFGFYYENRNPEDVFRFYFGYVSFLPNLVGYLAFFLPTAVVPHIFVLFPLLMSSAAFCCFYATGFRSLVSSDRTRLLICLALAAVPMGDSLLIGNTMYSIWSLLLLLALLSLLPRPQGFAALVFRGGVMSLMVCSHPTSVLLIPIWISSALRERSRQAFVFYAVLVIVSLGYLAWGVRPGEFALPDLLEAVTATTTLVIERVFAVAGIGVHWARAAARNDAGELGSWMLWSSLVPVALLVLGLVSAPRKPTRDQRFQLLGLAYVIVAVTAFGWFMRGAGSEEIGRHLRYFFVQRELTILLAMSCAFLCLELRDKRFVASAQLAVSLAVFLGWIGLLNYFDNWRYEVRRTSGYQVETFISDVVRQEKSYDGDRSRVRARLSRGVFSIALGRRSASSSR